jgi:hypothetical protein
MARGQNQRRVLRLPEQTTFSSVTQSEFLNSIMRPSRSSMK